MPREHGLHGARPGDLAFRKHVVHAIPKGGFTPPWLHDIDTPPEVPDAHQEPPTGDAETPDLEEEETTA